MGLVLGHRAAKVHGAKAALVNSEVGCSYVAVMQLTAPVVGLKKGSLCAVDIGTYGNQMTGAGNCQFFGHTDVVR